MGQAFRPSAALEPMQNGISPCNPSQLGWALRLSVLHLTLAGAGGWEMGEGRDLDNSLGSWQGRFPEKLAREERQ